MKLKLFSAGLGIILIAFGFSLQPVHSDSKGFNPHKIKMKDQTTEPTLVEMRNKLRSHMSTSERALYNKVREISKHKDKTTQERINELVELTKAEDLNRPKRNIILSNAVLLAHIELEGSEREERLKELEELAPHSKWLLKKNPNSNLLKISKIQYAILTGHEDI